MDILARLMVIAIVIIIKWIQIVVIIELIQITELC